MLHSCCLLLKENPELEDVLVVLLDGEVCVVLVVLVEVEDDVLEVVDVHVELPVELLLGAHVDEPPVVEEVEVEELFVEGVTHRSCLAQT